MGYSDMKFINLTCADELRSDTSTKITLFWDNECPRLLSEFDGCKAHLTGYNTSEDYQVKVEKTDKYRCKLVLVSKLCNKPAIEITPDYTKDGFEKASDNRVPMTIWKESVIERGSEIKVYCLSNNSNLPFIITGA